ncbi:MAG: sigma-70 family RNA polymerase sigma factor [Planctomycetes bacterium]|nr:sigma-70 family RNA polymerase sigma factor [Planctomycetota bacterium]
MTNSRDKKTAPPAAKVSAWFKAARDGQSSAIDQLLEAYRPLLLKLANDQLDPELRQKAAASDLVQNSLIKATLAFPTCQFDKVQDVVSWLQEILANEIVTAHRRYRKAKKRDARRERPINSAHSRMWIDYLAIHARTDDSVTLSRQDDITRVRVALDCLPPHYRQVITWRIVDGLKFGRIAVKLDRTEDAVRMLWNRAMRRLKSELRKLEAS